MSKKKTISLPDYVTEIAEKKSRIMFGGNFSSYLQHLICSDNTDEVKRLLEEEENKKPRKTSDLRKAEFTSKCPYCGKQIKVGDKICSALFQDGHEKFVHAKCCKE
jgi:hypothetical protein